MAKKIGIYASSMGDNAFGVGKFYLNFISKFGEPKIMSPDEIYREDLDALLLPGGMDVAPSAFDAIPGYFTSNTDVFKQHVYDNCLPKYVEGGKAIFGICLGLQQLAAYFGSVIEQDLPYHAQSERRQVKAHKITIIKPNGNMVTTDVNSHHHQGVLRDKLSTDLKVLAYAENEEWGGSKAPRETDIIEGFRHVTLPIAAVQFHPEEWYSPFAENLFKSILNH